MNPTAPVSGVRRAHDFPDWIQPCLVRSLRQGLRSRMFVALFLWAQVSTGALVGWHACSAEALGARNSWGLLYWVNAFVLFAVLVPLCPVFLKDEDMEPSNFDLITLTRMSSNELFLGRFIGLAVHGVIILTAVLPYQLLRYYIPGVELSVDMEALAWIFANMLLLAPWGILVGTMKLGPRIFFAALLLFSLLFVFVGFMVILLAPHRGFANSPWVPWMAIGLVFGLVGFGLGASRYEMAIREPEMSP